jgi:hypothetical protein
VVAAHAAPAAAAISEETIISEILRPAAAVEPTIPSRPRAATPVASAGPPPRRGWVVGAGIAAALAAVGIVWVASSRNEAPPPPPAAPVAAAPAAPALPSRPLVAGRYYAIDDLCPHANALLSQGWSRARRSNTRSTAHAFMFRAASTSKGPATVT